MPPCVQYDDLWPDGPRFLRSGAGFALGTDSVLLADFAAHRRVRRFADLGCGAGVLTVLLLHTLPQATAVGVELQPDAAQLACGNIKANGLNARAEILCADLREHRTVLPAGGFDLVVANPPYFAEGRGYTSPDPMRAYARDERTCTMQDICAAMAYLTRWGGSAALVHRPERLSELLCALTAAGLEPKRLRAVAHTADAAPSLVLVEARRGGKPGLSILPPLALCAPDGTDSDEICRIYHRRTQP